jgi:hypothetical protein
LIVARFLGGLLVSAAEVPGDLLFLQDREPGLWGSEVERGPLRAFRVADQQFVWMRVTLGMAVEELAEQRPAGALHLGDQDERLADRHPVVDTCPAEQFVLGQCIESLPCRCVHAGTSLFRDLLLHRVKVHEDIGGLRSLPRAKLRSRTRR